MLNVQNSETWALSQANPKPNQFPKSLRRFSPKRKLFSPKTQPVFPCFSQRPNQFLPNGACFSKMSLNCCFYDPPPVGVGWRDVPPAQKRGVDQWAHVRARQRGPLDAPGRPGPDHPAAVTDVHSVEWATRSERRGVLLWGGRLEVRRWSPWVVFYWSVGYAVLWRSLQPVEVEIGRSGGTSLQGRLTRVVAVCFAVCSRAKESCVHMNVYDSFGVCRPKLQEHGSSMP